MNILESWEKIMFIVGKKNRILRMHNVVLHLSSE